MDEERRSFLLDCYAKEWDPAFLGHRDFKEDGSYLKWKKEGLEAQGLPLRVDGRDPQVDGEGLRCFLRDYDDGGPLCGAEDVEEFCKDRRLQDILSAESPKRLKRNVWLDDRSRSGKYREYQNPLTPYKLLRALEEPRFEDKEKPDADRRRMLFVDLEPDHILVLAETASERQVPVLRDAIQKHLALETSLRVHMPLKGISMFHLELHLPYFALRQSTKPAGAHRGRKRQCIDLSFLTGQSNSGPSQPRYKLFEAHISFVISGWEDSRWVAWSFVDNYFEKEDELLDIDGYPYQDFAEDPIARGQLDQNKPLVNPREYFLMILNVRSEQILEEWECVVQSVRRNVKRYRDEQYSNERSKPPQTASQKAEQIQETFDWTVQTRELISRLDHRLSWTIEAWKMFNDADGDSRYFGGIHSMPNPSQQRVRLYLPAIKVAFERLQALHRELVHLKEVCHESMKLLKIRLTIGLSDEARENSRASRQINEAVRQTSEAARQNGLATTFTLTIMSPCGLVVAYFALGPNFISFPMNSRTLGIAVLLAISVVWVLFWVARVLLHSGGLGRALEIFGFLGRERAAPCSHPCAKGGDSINKWRNQVRSSWDQHDVETGTEMTAVEIPDFDMTDMILPTRPERVLGRRHTA